MKERKCVIEREREREREGEKERGSERNVELWSHKHAI